MNTRESIFEVQWSSQTSGSWLWMMFHRNAYVPNDSFSWAKWSTPSRNLTRAYNAEGDTERLNASVVYDECGWSYQYPSDEYAFMHKFPTNVTPVYVMRLADIRLLHAEALANSGDPGGAADIVDEISGIVGQHINMMDERGNIIASTDGTRVGHFHAGAKRIVEEGLPELYVRPEDATPTVRAGLNLPITHGGRTVGVIGITGAYEQVIGYGQVVKKMTEILIREGNEQDEKRLDQRVRSRFLEDWVLGGGLLQPQVLAERGLALGVDITVPRRVMVVSVRDLARYTDTAAGQKRIDQLETAVSGLVEGEAGGIILRNTARQILLLRARPDAQMQAMAQRLCVMARERFGLRLAVGIDGGAPDVHRAYAQANKAWRSARMAPEGVLPYDSVTLELFTGDVPRQTKEEYLRKVFRGCTYEELRRWIGLLEAYFAAEGSIQAAADALYIHKNTLQYRLKRLEELTGCDVRRPSQAPVFYMAVLFFKEVEGSLLLMGS